MTHSRKLFSAVSLIVFVAALAALPTDSAWPQEPTNKQLLERIETLESELRNLRDLLLTNMKTAEQAREKAAVAEVKAIEATKAAHELEKQTAYPSIPDTIWHLAGYASAGAEFRTKANEWDFGGVQFNPGFHFQYKDLIIFEAELEMEIEADGETEFELEYSQFDILLHDYATLVVGKYLSPIGQFKERLHPSWINKFSNAPAGFGHDGAQPDSEVGVQLRGGIPIGERSTLTYVLALGNGPRMGHEGNAEFEGFGGDDNKNKAFGGRIAFLPMPYLEIGGSFWKGKLDGIEGPGELLPTSAYAKVWGVDGAFTRNAFDVRFEYLKNTRGPINSFDEDHGEVEMLEKLSLEAWYAQIAYRLPQFGNASFTEKLEPVFRYGEFRVKGSHHLEEQAHKRYNIGLNYWLAPSAVARVGLEIRRFFEEEIQNETLVQLQVAYGF
ncbi:MAG: hypothetical protein IH996_07160 [Proteobacteria bacterium]|nr:hypothetical protein [Pseudomonadota bacterium]